MASISFRRRFKQLALMVVIAYAIICATVYLAQGWLAFPGSVAQGKNSSKIHYSNNPEIVHFKTSNGISITAVFGAAATPDRPTILYFYGNGGSVAWSQNEFDHFRALNCNVLIPDFPGFGENGGTASEINFYATADAAWYFLKHRPGVDPKQIIVVGWSMGAAVAIDLASRRPVAGLATFNAFTDLPAMARGMFPWLPTKLLLKYKFDNQTKIAAVQCPMLICNGKLDRVVSPMMSDRLAAVAGGPVTRAVIESADHNSIFIAEPDKVWRALGEWVGGLKF